MKVLFVVFVISVLIFRVRDRLIMGDTTLYVLEGNQETKIVEDSTTELQKFHV